MNEKLKDNIRSLVRIGLGCASGYLAKKGIDADVAGLEEIISAAILLLGAAVWAWWKNRKGAQK